ncbi:MAG: hypothetical protein A3F18_05985 [Legionellales bacterium RIFCSPHIGHO2_12_FULL_37_14]|nr:MAG: hypothetical protein A3F18_05985 [Legionellales bacterium RIFCSPHIGHO2_12_FULL_37_14]
MQFRAAFSLAAGTGLLPFGSSAIIVAQSMSLISAKGGVAYVYVLCAVRPKHIVRIFFFNLAGFIIT